MSENSADTESQAGKHETLSDRAKQSREAMLKMMADIEPTISEYENLKEEEAAQLKASTGWEIADLPKKPNAIEGFTDLPESVRKTTERMLQEINAKRAYQNLPPLEAHGTDVGRFLNILKSGKMEKSHFGAFSIGTYGKHGVPQMGFFDNSPIWVIKPTNATTFPLTLGELNFVIPNPKGQREVLKGLVQKIDAGEIEGVGAAVMNVRQFGKFMNATNNRLPTEVRK